MRIVHGVLIRDLEWIVTLAEIGHVTEAAAAIGTGQPTLSRALARMETELGARIFERGPGGVSLTPVGEVIVAGARDTAARFARLRADVAGLLDPDAGVVRLAFLDSSATSVVPELLGRVHRAAPGLRIELRQQPGHEIVADLVSGAIDLGVIGPRPTGGYEWSPLQEERLVLVVPPGHRLAGRRRVALREIAGEDLVTTPVGFGSRAQFDDLLRGAGVRPRVAFESEDLATIEALVGAGLGVAIVPSTLAGRSGSVGLAISGAPQARRTVGLAWRSDRPPSPPLARFLAILGAGG